MLTACTYPFVRQYDEHKLQLTSTLHTGNLNFQVEVFEPLHLMNCAVYVDIHTTVTTQAVTSVVKRIFKEKLKHPQSLRQMYYNNNTAQHSLLRDKIIENKRN